MSDRPLTGVELARLKLAEAKADARKRGQLPRQEPRRRAAPGPGRSDPLGEAGDPLSPARDTMRLARDPQPLGRAIADLLADRGWERQTAIGGVFGRWSEIVGPDLAAHTRPEHFEDGVVVVAAESTAWATQVRLLAANLVRRLNEELGHGTVQRVKVKGPTGGPRPTGPLRVRGGRGPGDTYG